MSLGTVLQRYLISYEEHTGVDTIELEAIITKATLGEIKSEYNKLTKLKLWHEALQTVFYGEFLRRILGMMFMISTSWIPGLQLKPTVTVQIGDEDSFYVPDEGGNPILTDGPWHSFALTDASFMDDDASKIKRLLITGTISAEISEHGDNYVITKIFNTKDPMEAISYMKPNNPVIVECRFAPDPDFEMMSSAILGLGNSPMILK